MADPSLIPPSRRIRAAHLASIGDALDRCGRLIAAASILDIDGVEDRDAAYAVISAAAAQLVKALDVLAAIREASR